MSESCFALHWLASATGTRHARWGEKMTVIPGSADQADSKPSCEYQTVGYGILSDCLEILVAVASSTGTATGESCESISNIEREVRKSL